MNETVKGGLALYTGTHTSIVYSNNTKTAVKKPKRTTHNIIYVLYIHRKYTKSERIAKASRYNGKRA